MTNRQKLDAKLDLHYRAFGADAKSAHIDLMERARATGDETFIGAVLDYVDRNAPNGAEEIAALASISSEIASAATSTAPALFVEISVPQPQEPLAAGLTADQYMQNEQAMGWRWAFRAESAATPTGQPLAARILVPSGGCDFRLVEAAARTGVRWHQVVCSPAAAAQARPALLTAALARAAARKVKA